MVDKSAFDIDKCDGIEVLRFATGRSGFLSIHTITHPRLQKSPDQGSYHLRTNSLGSDSKNCIHSYIPIVYCHYFTLFGTKNLSLELRTRIVFQQKNSKELINVVIL